MINARAIFAKKALKGKKISIEQIKSPKVGCKIYYLGLTEKRTEINN
jgi:hypothetical protein